MGRITLDCLPIRRGLLGMKWFQRNKKVEDERIVSLRNKLYKETYIVIAVLCFVSIAVKWFVYGQGTENIMSELSILLVSSLYFLIRSAYLGLYADEVEVHDRSSRFPMSLKNVFWGLGVGIAISVFMGIRSTIEYGDGGLHSLWTFVIVFLGAFMIYVPLLVVVLLIGHALAKKGSKTQDIEP